MIHAIYNLLWTLATPPGRLYLRASSKNHELLQRLEPPPALTPGVVWIHACSVGEVGVARSLAQALAQLPASPRLLFTTSTRTGMAQAQRQLAPLGQVAWCPFDSPHAVRRFLRAARPALLLLTETEIWPNLLREARQAEVPVMLYNGRLSARHLGQYQRYRRLFSPAFSSLTVAAMQDETYAARITTLGTPSDHVCVTGNLKFDAVTTNVEASTRSRLRAQHGIPGDSPVIVAGSTRPGDEIMLAASWADLRDAFPAAHLIVAPRHLERADQAAAAFSEPVLRRSSLSKGALPQGERVHLIDTHGELTQFYSLGTAAVIGGSFCSEVQGHNPLEPAALGVPVIHGPHMANFAEAAEVLREARGAITVTGAGDMTQALRRLLSDPAECRHMGTRARKAVLERQGATQRTIRIIQELLALREAPSPEETPIP